MSDFYCLGLVNRSANAGDRLVKIEGLVLWISNKRPGVVAWASAYRYLFLQFLWWVIPVYRSVSH